MRNKLEHAVIKEDRDKPIASEKTCTTEQSIYEEVDTGESAQSNFNKLQTHSETFHENSVCRDNTVNERAKYEARGEGSIATERYPYEHCDEDMFQETTLAPKGKFFVTFEQLYNLHKAAETLCSSQNDQASQAHTGENYYSRTPMTP